MRVWLLLFSLLVLPSCGGGGIERVEQTVVEGATKGALKFFGRAFEYNAPPLETYKAWAYFFANAGGLFLFAGLIMLWLMTDKRRGVRMMGMGFSFVAMAKVIEISKTVIDDWTGVILLALTALTVIWIFIRFPKRIEKLLLKFNIRWDIDGDGKYGTNSHKKPPEDPFNEKPTDKIEHGGGLLPPDNRPMDDRTHG